MSNIGNTEALEKYLQLEQENKRLRTEIKNWEYKYNEYYTAWNKVSDGLNTLFNWLETRKDTKTETIQRKMAEIFKYAYMQAHFEEFRSKWKNQESIEWARKNYPEVASLLTQEKETKK